ncbi:MAG TPA: hypothetical protein VIL60_01750 [Rhodanobacter sp.]
MLDLHVPDMTFPKIAYGTHARPHDLRVLLYRGGAGAPSSLVANLIASGSLGAPRINRLPLVLKLHEAMSAELMKGKSQATVIGTIHAIRAFYAWGDAAGNELTLATVESDYGEWVEALLHRARVVCSINELTAYRTAKCIDPLLSAALETKLGLLRRTRLKAPKDKRRVLGTKADKQNLEETFEFGHALLDITDALTVETIRGPLPVMISFRNGKVLQEWCKLKPVENVKALHKDTDHFHNRKKVLAARAAWVADTSLRTRYPLANLRIEAEILIFISQTSMNLAQAHKLRRGEFRFQSDGGDIHVYRVYKGRRGGQADFRIFKEYRPLFERYIAWLDEIVPESDDARLFPFVYTSQIPAAHYAPTFKAIQTRCARLGIRAFRPQALRNTRVNWLLRRSCDPELTAEMAQHTQETLIRVYQQPNHQVAAKEITRFHQLTDPSIAPPGPGACIELRRSPRPIVDMPLGAPTPDCVSPSGCLFCDFHRDIESQDYIWSLASYRYLKAVELSQYHPPSKGTPAHPVVAVLNRISDKLNYFEASNEIRAQWVREARDRISESRFHPAWDGFIQLMELRA